MEYESDVVKINISPRAIKVVLMIVIIALSLFLWSKGKEYGGKLACKNTEARLVEGFKCEFPQNASEGRILPKKAGMNLKIGAWNDTAKA